MDNTVDYKEIISQGVFFVIGTLLVALAYNLFLFPNDLVVGGASGIAILVEGITGFSANLFIYIASVVLIICSFIFLGYEETKNTIIGSLLYPLFLTFTTPVARVLLPYLEFEETFVTIAFAALFFGVGSGLVYKCGFNTGGTDVLVRISSKYLHIPEGKSIMIINSSAVIFAGFVFGIDKVIYAIIIIAISSLLVDKILIGISDSKMFLIYTRKLDEVKKIIDSFKTGYTLLPTEGGYSHKKGVIVMCAIRNRDYMHFKETILDVDPTAFFIINDCYEVNGGVKQPNLPFF